MCSVARSAQADIQRVESKRMTSARQRDQWTTALWWWPGTGEEQTHGLGTWTKQAPKMGILWSGDTHCDNH